MTVRKRLLTAMIVALGCLLGTVAAGGKLATLYAADEKPAATSQAPVLPTPPVPFKGIINLRAKESKSDFPQPIQAPNDLALIITASTRATLSSTMEPLFQIGIKILDPLSSLSWASLALLSRMTDSVLAVVAVAARRHHS